MQPRTARWLMPIASMAVACLNSDTVGTSNLLAGTYVAATFRVTVPGNPQADVLAAGGSLSITIDKSGSTTGSLSIPASVTGVGPLTASMAGTAVITALTVQFDQGANTFVRDLTWSRLGGTTLTADQTIGSTTYSISMIHP